MIGSLKFKTQRGFTLVELILYMGLLSIFLVVLTDIFVSIFDIKTESEATSAVEQDGRYILSRLSYDLRRADAVNIPLNIGQTTDNLVLSVGATSYSYQESGGNLVINDGQPDNLNSSETRISAAPTFERVGNPGGKETIKLEFTIESRTQRDSGPETRTYQMSIGRR